MPNETLDELLNEALPLWGQVAGLIMQEGPVRRYTPSSWRAEQHAGDLAKSRLDDPSGCTTLLVLRGLADHYLQGSKLSVRDLVRNYDEVAPVIERGRKLLDLLGSPAAEEAVAGARAELAQACDHYELDADHRVKVLGLDDYDLGILAHHARCSLKKLRRFDFAQADGGASPGYNPWVCEFWNVASLVCALAEQKVSGVSLVLFRDPKDVFQSYFALSVRSGGTISVFTDKSNYAHPGAADMRRRPDQDLERRAEQHYFPYDLLGLREVQDPASPAKTMLIEEERHQIARVNTAGVRLRQVRDLEPAQFVWLAHVFRELLQSCERGERAPEMAYTADMIRYPTALADRCVALQAPGAYRPLELAPVIRADLEPEALAPQWGRPSTGFNRWMVERYGNRVPEEVLNAISESDRDKLLPALRDEGLLSRPEPYRLDPGPSPLSVLGPNHFGTARELDQDRKWCARVNQCRIIQKLAAQEYQETRDGVLEWYKAAVRRNKDRLAQGLAEGRIEVAHADFQTWDDAATMTRRNGLRVEVAGETAESHGRCFRFADRFTVAPWQRSGKYQCVDREVVATVVGMITPTCPEAVAELCGTTVEKLPWQLRHFYGDHPYAGNHILDRIDPEDWVLENPWLKMRLGFVVALSKTAYRARRRAACLDPDGVLAPKPDSSGSARARET